MPIRNLHTMVAKANHRMTPVKDVKDQKIHPMRILLQKNEDSRMIRDHRWYFTDKDDAKAFFPPSPVSVCRELHKESKTMLSKRRISMTNDCKEKGIRNTIKEMLDSTKNER